MFRHCSYYLFMLYNKEKKVINMSEELRRGIPKGVIIGHVEFSVEEKEQNRKRFEIILKAHGVLKENESLKKE